MIDLMISIGVAAGMASKVGFWTAVWYGLIWEYQLGVRLAEWLWR
jgi:hypothetical protein